MNEVHIKFDVRQTSEEEKMVIAKLLKAARLMWICPNREILTVSGSEWDRAKLKILKMRILKIKTVKELKNEG